jgi:hypothetical protein
MRTSNYWPLIALGMLTAACSSNAGNTCSTDEECDSKFCRADGTCAPSGLDATPTVDGPKTPDGPLGCAPNGDDSLAASEYPIRPGASARFRTAQNATISSAGTPLAGNKRRWDLTGTLSGDTDTDLASIVPTGAWWAAKFPTATYAAKLSITSDLLGVFAADANGVNLLGIVTPTDGISRTEIKYTPPIAVLQFPAIAGQHWTTSTSASGVINGVISAYTEDYDNLVDASGTVATPYGEFPALRIKTEFTQTVGFLVTKRRTFGFVAECFGSIASMVSKDNPAAGELTTVSELRRLIP